MKVLTPDYFLNDIFAPCDDNANKGNFGKSLMITGSYGMAGASVMACSSALRCGVGLCENLVHDSIYPICSVKNPEAVFSVYEDENSALELLESRLPHATACLMGCGSGNNRLTLEQAKFLLNNCNVPLVIDADGINVVSKHIFLLQKHSCFTVLTPHPGEMARLMNTTVDRVQANREKYALEFAEKYDVCLVLKGHNTVVAFPDGECFVNPTGNYGMAKGGSGDVLAGMITAFLARGIQPKKAVAGGVYLHGLAGDYAARKLSKTAMLPTDIICELHNVFLNFEK